MVKRILNSVLSLLMVISLVGCSNKTTNASEVSDKYENVEKTNESAKYFTLFTFDNDSYRFSEAKVDNTHSVLGSFSIQGKYKKSTEEIIPEYNVDSGNLRFTYEWKYNADESENQWYIGLGNNKKIDLYDIEKKMGTGTIIIQSSKDKINWSTNDVVCNFIEELCSNKKYIYETNEIQINSGCYYRVIVAYKLERYTKKKVFGFEKKEFEYDRVAEVYTIYAYNQNTINNDSTKEKTKYVLSDNSKWCRQFLGYADVAEIPVDDIHYNWKLGDFLASGHTDVIKDNENNPVILKNVGDQIKLWFRLEQNIDSLNGDDSLRITSDNAGSDQYFGTTTQDFGRGALIIRKKDYQNEQNNLDIYTNYLAGYVIPGVDTMISLFEEGDYEVSLDYEVTKDTLKIFDKKLLDKTRHYKMSFTFSVRNSNCMAYPFDVKTGEKLINGAYSKDGFYLDFAKSRYLQINVKRSDIKDGTFELVEDVSFNQLAKDGDSFTDEGLYTVTVRNRYTGATDEKKIYVGENDILKAHAVTGKSISEIQMMISKGAVINEDGSIGKDQYDENVKVYGGLDDEDLLEYVKYSVYSDIIDDFIHDDCLVEKIDTKYISLDYLENLAYNSKNNLYFGYDADQLNKLFEGEKYIFTAGDDFTTIVKPIKTIDNSITDDVVKNVAVGSGVILVCATVSFVSLPFSPAVSVIFAASASTGTAFALQSGAISGITAAILRAYQTGDVNEAIKAGAVSGSEGFKWGAIVGVISGGVKETYGLYKATEHGLTMNQAAKIQTESKLPLEVIRYFSSVEEYEIYKVAGLTKTSINGTYALTREINLTDIVDDMGRTNVQRIADGLSPVDANGISYELHHIGQNSDSPLAILTRSEHRSSDNYKILHKLTESDVEHAEAWTKQVKDFWKAYIGERGYHV